MFSIGPQSNHNDFPLNMNVYWGQPEKSSHLFINVNLLTTFSSSQRIRATFAIQRCWKNIDNCTQQIKNDHQTGCIVRFWTGAYYLLTGELNNLILFGLVHNNYGPRAAPHTWVIGPIFKNHFFDANLVFFTIQFLWFH